MGEISETLRDIADLLETVATVGTSETDYEITNLTPCPNDVLATDSVSVELGVRIPFLRNEDAAAQLALTPQEVQLNDDGSLHVGLTITASSDRQDSGEKSVTTPLTTEDSESSQSAGAQTPTASNRGSATSYAADPNSPSKSPSKGASNEASDPSGEDTGATTDESADSPAYRDPALLEAVYEDYDTFAEMTDALDVDVTPQTVRRYMIKYGIHEPASTTGSRTAETLLAAEPESVSSAVRDRTQQGTDSTSATEDSPTSQQTPTDTSAATNGHRATTNGRPESDSAAAEDSDTSQTTAPTESTSPSETSGASVSGSVPETSASASGANALPTESSDDDQRELDDTGDADAEANAIDGDSVDDESDEDVMDVDVDLPDHLTLADIKTTVQNAQTLYEAQQQLDLARNEAQDLLQELDLLDFVHGRLTTRDLVDRTLDDVNQRLQSTAR
jgi:hypothetical protein